MNTREREHIGRLIQRFAAKAATDDLLILIAEHSGLLEACKHLLAEAKDPVTAAWLRSECEAAKTRPGLFQAEIEAILTIIKPSQEHADLYALLELEPGAGREAIKRNYRRLSRRYHPDSGGSKQDEDTFIRITQAYQRLLASADSTPGELPTPRRENSATGGTRSWPAQATCGVPSKTAQRGGGGAAVAGAHFRQPAGCPHLQFPGDDDRPENKGGLCPADPNHRRHDPNAKIPRGASSRRRVRRAHQLHARPNNHRGRNRPRRSHNQTNQRGRHPVLRSPGRTRRFNRPHRAHQYHAIRPNHCGRN